jgi:hypothetical protein
MNKYLQNLKSIIKNINLPFQVMEDNGGGLHLLIFNEKFEIIYMSTNFEYNQGELTSALIEISDKTQSEIKTIISSWETSYDENSWDIMDEYEKLTQDRVGVFTIVDNQGVYPALMGNAGIIEFKILEGEN